MGPATCGHCGAGATVNDPARPWQCPTCGKVTGGRTGLDTATRAGYGIVVFGLAALVMVVTFLAVFVY